MNFLEKVPEIFKNPVILTLVFESLLKLNSTTQNLFTINYFR